MHEISIMRALFGEIERIAREHDAEQVVHVVLEVGEISNVVPDLLERAFVAFRDVEPLLEDARLEIKRVPLTLRCRSCDGEFERDDSRFLCPGCLSTDVDVTRGEELVLRDLELEVS